MFKIPQSTINEFKRIFDTHKVHIAAANVFYQNIRLINGHHKLIDRDMFQNTFLSMLSDIELVTPPTDAFVPVDSEEDTNDIFIPNQLVPEYMEIQKRVTLALIEDALGSTNEIVIQVKEKPELMTRVHDDIFIYFMLFKYIDQIDLIRLKTFSNYTPIIEYVVDNITEQDWKNYLVTKRPNQEKYVKNCEDIIFNPDMNMTHKFYASQIEDSNIPNINVQDLIIRLVTNLVFNYDIYVVFAVYMILSFAMADFKNDNITESKCANYVVDVLSKL